MAKKRPASAMTPTQTALEAMKLARMNMVGVVNRLVEITARSQNHSAAVRAGELITRIARVDEIQEPIQAQLNVIKVNFIDDTKPQQGLLAAPVDLEGGFEDDEGEVENQPSPSKKKQP